MALLSHSFIARPYIKTAAHAANLSSRNVYVVHLCGDTPDQPQRLFTYEAFLRGTFLPSLRAFERPMAIACSRLLTLPPLPPGPLFAVPRL
jgi:hypothetical protein